MKTITYNIHRFYTADGVLAEPYRTVTLSTETQIGREVIAAFEHAGKLYIGACYAGCVITSLEETKETETN